VPSFDALTPVPARACVTCVGRRTGGQTFKHRVEHGVLLAFSVYTVVPLTRIVPSVGFVIVDTTTLPDL
jgi:hypothetical protein